MDINKTMLYRRARAEAFSRGEFTYDESQHPRAPAGGPDGGQWTVGPSGGHVASGTDSNTGKYVSREAKDRRGRGIKVGDKASYDHPDTNESSRGTVSGMQIHKGGVALHIKELPSSWVYADEVTK